MLCKFPSLQGNSGMLPLLHHYLGWEMVPAVAMVRADLWMVCLGLCKSNCGMACPLNEPFKIDHTKMGTGNCDEISRANTGGTVVLQSGYPVPTTLLPSGKGLLKLVGICQWNWSYITITNWTSLLGFFNLNFCPKRSMTLVIRWSSYSFPIAQEQGNWKWPLEYEIPKASSHSMLVFWGVIPLLPTHFDSTFNTPVFVHQTLCWTVTQRSISYQMHFANLNHAFTARRCSVARSLAKTTFLWSKSPR